MEAAESWTMESWENERLRDGGITSASNESSIVLYGSFPNGERILLTGDAGPRALSHAAREADRLRLPLQRFTFVQVPHHGSRANVGPAILDRLLGPKQPRGSAPRLVAFVSAPKDDATHPRQMVLNAFMRRGTGIGGRPEVGATQGQKIIHWGGFPTRDAYTTLSGVAYDDRVEDYN